MLVKLKVLQGNHEGKEITVSDEKYLIGRSDGCHLRPKSEAISRKHCILVIKDNKLLVQDLKSRNGTYVNDKKLPVDRAKVLKAGDRLRVGKLSFEVVIEHGLTGTKRPEVSDVQDAAARTVEAGSNESRFEAVDVSAWLDEADQIDRVRRQGDSETRQFRLDQIKAETSDVEDPGDGSSAELSVEDSKLEKRSAKAKPGKLPSKFKAAMKENSRDAADDALKRFFTR